MLRGLIRFIRAGAASPLNSLYRALLPQVLLLVSATAHRKFFRKPSRAITADANVPLPCVVRNEADEVKEKKRAGKGTEKNDLVEKRRAPIFLLFRRALRYAIMRLTLFGRRERDTDRAGRMEERVFGRGVKRAVKLAPHNARLLKGSLAVERATLRLPVSSYYDS